MIIIKRVLSILIIFVLLLSIILLESINVFADKSEVSFSMKYSDVKESDWFYESVRYMTKNGLMNETSENRFSPKENTSRSMIVTILYRLEETPKVVESKFKDVPSKIWYTDAVSWASENGIVMGYGNELFGPNDSITREQMTTILYRYAQYKGYDTTQGGMAIREFEDYESISEYALSTMAWTVNTGLIQGNNNKIMPKNIATRDQVAEVLMKFIEKISK